MKRGIGVFALAAILATGSRFAVSPKASTGEARVLTASTAQELRALQPGDTSCPEFGSPSGGKPTATNTELATLVSQFLHGSSAPPRQPGPLPRDLRFVIATVPDPLHTLLNLQFDRAIESIQQGAQDEGFSYDSSWLPWKARAADFSGRTDQIDEDKDNLRRELCPGLILFRKNKFLSGDGAYDDTYTHGLFVFLVGEKPTTGINQTQWDNALAWIQLHADPSAFDHALRVLGPTFSGSVPSMARSIAHLRKPPAYFTNVLLYSGTMGGCSSYRWLREQLNRAAPVPTRFADFSQNDAIQIDRYFSYLRSLGHTLSEVAILSEDETAYGGLPDVAPAEAPRVPQPTPINCEPTYSPDDAPLHLYYPRDISTLRSAYQEQSIFGPSASTESNTAHVILQPQAAHSTHANTDTIATFSGPNFALAQEAQMYGIVDSLRTHGIRFVVLRSTSTLDYLFLARFLHHAYPDAFIITTGPDILFGREIDSTEFRGVEALTTFPLLPRGQDWTRAAIFGARHAHRVFSTDSMESSYIAMRFLLSDPESRPDDAYPFVHPVKADISDYDTPFWMSKSGGPIAPPTWLTVIGRDGYWPVAILTSTLDAHKSPASTVTRIFPSTPPDSQINPAHWKLSLSAPWKFCCALAFSALCLHLYACVYGRSQPNQSMFVQFFPSPTQRQFLVLGFGWAIIGSIVLLMNACSDRIGALLDSSHVFWVGLLHCAVWLAGIGIVVDIGVRSRDATSSALTRALCACLWIAFPLSLLGAARFAGSNIFDPAVDNSVATAYRAVHLSSGVSPMVSLLCLLVGLYWWFWQSLCGLALLGRGRPILPRNRGSLQTFARMTDDMAANIESLAIPFPGIFEGQAFVYLVPLVLLGLPIYTLVHHGKEGIDAMLHSFESIAFNRTLQILFLVALYFMILECTQLLGTWLSLNRLLVALSRTPLRRTFAALQGLSMHSLWSLSGTTSRARYAVFSHQFESLIHLRNVLPPANDRTGERVRLQNSIRATCDAGKEFLRLRSTNADLAMVNDDGARDIRLVFSRCTEEIFGSFILPEWSGETRSLDLLEIGAGPEKSASPPLGGDPSIRRAEEFVCFIYVGYLQNLLARMRTMVLAILGLFAGLAFSLAFYPFTPRPTIAIGLLLLLLVLGSVVAVVYAGLSRDTTLSQITNTSPGEIGSDFWIRFASFIGVPIISLLIAQFPAITDFVTSWIQPSLGAAK